MPKLLVELEAGEADPVSQQALLASPEADDGLIHITAHIVHFGARIIQCNTAVLT